jgi:hypothetical protein
MVAVQLIVAHEMAKEIPCTCHREGWWALRIIVLPSAQSGPPSSLEGLYASICVPSGEEQPAASRENLCFAAVRTLRYEDEIRSVEGPGARKGGPEETAPIRLR